MGLLFGIDINSLKISLFCPHPRSSGAVNDRPQRVIFAVVFYLHKIIGDDDRISSKRSSYKEASI